MDKKTVPIIVDGREVGTAEVEWDPETGQSTVVVGKITDPKLSRNLSDSTEFSIVSARMHINKTGLYDISNTELVPSREIVRQAIDEMRRKETDAS